MQTTNTNGNKANGIKGSRVSIFANDGTVIDRIEVPVYRGHGNAEEYCKSHPGGKYGSRYSRAVATAKALDAGGTVDDWHWFVAKIAM